MESLGKLFWIISALERERTVVATVWPRERRMSRMWAAMKPLPPGEVAH